MELQILITMVVTLVGCLAGVILMAGVATALLLVTGQGFRKSFNYGFLLGAMPLLAPAFMVACNVGFFLPTFEVIRDGTRAPGTVVGYSESNSDGSTTYSSIVEFETTDGTTVRFDDTAVSSNPPRHSIGDRVDVLYLPEQPELAVISDFWWWVLPTFLGLVTLVMVPIGFFFAWRSFRKGTWSMLDFLSDLF